jgi:hypothetical protein
MKKQNGATRNWLAVVPAALIVALMAALVVRPVLAQPGSGEAEQALEAAVRWLVSTRQNDDGGFTSFSAGANQAASDIPGTLDALTALSVAGAPEEQAPLGFLVNNSPALLAYGHQDGAAAGKAVLALIAAGQNPRAFGGEDYVLTLSDHLSPTGEFGVSAPFQQALALQATAVAGDEVSAAAIAWLVDRQARDGSWDDGFGTAGNADATAMAIQALLAAGFSDNEPVITNARAFLAESQTATGGWEYGPGFGENANSTALVLLALDALGEPYTDEDGPWAQNGVTPPEALLAWQGGSGAFQADFGSGRNDDFFSTVQAIPALAALVADAPGAAPVNGPDWLPWLLVALALALALGLAAWARRR